MSKIHHQRQAFSIIMLLFLVLLTSTVYADPRTGPVTPTNSITGTFADDYIGSNGVYLLPSGNIVILSPNWNEDRGAVTCLTPSEYRKGDIRITAENSLVGDSPGDEVGGGVGDVLVILANGNYVVLSPEWGAGPLEVIGGAVTWVNGITCIPAGESTRGAVVSSTNSVVDTKSNFGATPLTNGHYVITTRDLVTWANGETGMVGMLSEENSLVGGSPNAVVPLTNGNYVVAFPNWDNGYPDSVGAVAWGNGNGGTVGQISAANALIGKRQQDHVGEYVIALANGHYVVASPDWSNPNENGVAIEVGAVTWGNGFTGTFGEITPENSIIGLTAQDDIALGGLVALPNGHYLILSPTWGAAMGAVTWADGSGPTTGTVSAENSLVGSTPGDYVGAQESDYIDTQAGITILNNGNYVITSLDWHNGSAASAGAVTWGNGNGGTVGEISPANSLVGSTQDDVVGKSGVFPLTNGNYVVLSYLWDNGAITDAGAATWGNGNNGVVGEVSELNSLVGSTTSERLGYHKMAALTNGHYVVTSTWWDNGELVDAGQSCGEMAMVARWVSFRQTTRSSAQRMILWAGAVLLRCRTATMSSNRIVGLIMQGR